MSDGPIDLRHERGKRSGLAKDWDVGSTLVEAIRIRAEDPESLIANATRCVLVFGVEAPDGSTAAHVLAATRNGWETLGLLAEASNWIAE